MALKQFFILTQYQAIPLHIIRIWDFFKVSFCFGNQPSTIATVGILLEIITIIQWIAWTTSALMVIHFMIIFLTLACLLLIYFIAQLQVHFHLCIKINEYHSSLQNKLTVTENLHFPIYWTRIQESQLHFCLLLLLVLVFLPSIHLLFTSPFDMAFFTTSQFGEQLAQRRRNPH